MDLYRKPASSRDPAGVGSLGMCFEVPLQFLEENARPSPLTVEWEVPSGPTMGKLGTGPRQGCDRYLTPLRAIAGEIQCGPFPSLREPRITISSLEYEYETGLVAALWDPRSIRTTTQGTL